MVIIYESAVIMATASAEITVMVITMITVRNSNFDNHYWHTQRKKKERKRKGDARDTNSEIVELMREHDFLIFPLLEQLLHFLQFTIRKSRGLDFEYLADGASEDHPTILDYWDMEEQNGNKTSPMRTGRFTPELYSSLAVDLFLTFILSIPRTGCLRSTTPSTSIEKEVWIKPCIFSEKSWARPLMVKITNARIMQRDAAAILRRKYSNLQENCFPRPSGGCACTVRQRNGVETVENYDSDEQCKSQVAVVYICIYLVGRCNLLRYKKLAKMYAEELEGNVKHYEPDFPVQTMYNKKQLNEEIKDRYGNYKEDCFPMPSGVVNALKKMQLKNKRTTNERSSQNVRDPVRERAQANYRAVINELNEKFKGLKEGCFPRPKGCLCVIGKDRDGRDITERRMKDRDCKCQPGERGHGCPTSGA
ncbi:BMA-CCG-1, isoform a [Dirofilaria immitis]|nr:BMA-CCG-1, isoform a [Dirofilaria immitis]